MLSEFIIGFNIFNKLFSLSKSELYIAFLYIIKFIISFSSGVSLIKISKRLFILSCELIILLSNRIG